VSMHVENGTLNVFVVSDSPQPKEGEFTVDVIDLSGKVKSTKKMDVNIEPLKGKSYLAVPVVDLLSGADDSRLLVRATLTVEGQTVSANNYYFRPFKEMALERPNIKSEINLSGDGFDVKLSSDRVARTVNLYGLKSGFFEDNYFDLLPDRPVVIHYRNDGKLNLEEFRRTLKVRSLVDAFE